MTTTTTTSTTPATDDAVRLRMDPAPSRTTVLDGGWWPRSTDAVAELPALMAALTGLRGRITHILMNAGEWDLPHPRRATAAGATVKLGWFTSQPAGLITVMSDFGHDRFDLLVVPPDTGRAAADTALAAAADPADRRHTPELLAGVAAAGGPATEPAN